MRGGGGEDGDEGSGDESEGKGGVDAGSGYVGSGGDGADSGVVVVDMWGKQRASRVGYDGSSLANVAGACLRCYWGECGCRWGFALALASLSGSHRCFLPLIFQLALAFGGYSVWLRWASDGFGDVAVIDEGGGGVSS